MSQPLVTSKLQSKLDIPVQNCTAFQFLSPAFSFRLPFPSMTTLFAFDKQQFVIVGHRTGHTPRPPPPPPPPLSLQPRRSVAPAAFAVVSDGFLMTSMKAVSIYGRVHKSDSE
jgi:hypothetical protein